MHGNIDLIALDSGCGIRITDSGRLVWLEATAPERNVYGCGSSGTKILCREDKELRKVWVPKKGAFRVDWWWSQPLTLSPEDPEDARHCPRCTGSV